MLTGKEVGDLAVGLRSLGDSENFSRNRFVTDNTRLARPWSQFLKVRRLVRNCLANSVRERRQDLQAPGTREHGYEVDDGKPNRRDSTGGLNRLQN